MGKENNSAKNGTNKVKKSSEAKGNIQDAKYLALGLTSGGESKNPFCNLCKNSGALLSCSNCSRSFHLTCIHLTEEFIPVTSWYCNHCVIFKEKRLLEEYHKSQKKQHQKRISEMKQLLKVLDTKHKDKQQVSSTSVLPPPPLPMIRTIYPIDDILLLLNPELHNMDSITQIPSPRPTSIPAHLLEDLLYITDFFDTFKHILLIQPFLTEHLHQSLKAKSEEILYKDLITALLRILIEYMMHMPTETLGKCMFIMIAGRLKGILHPKDMLTSGYLYFLSEVLNSKLWKDYVHTEPTLHAILIDSKEKPLEYKFYERYYYADKLELLLFLINCVYETTVINNDISQRMELKSKLTKTKIDLKSKLKKIRKKIKSIGKKGINYSKLLQEESNLLTKLKEVHSTLQTHSVRTEPLGSDRHFNDYYTFKFAPECIYVRRDEPLNAEEDKSKDGYWYIYSTLEDIHNLKNSLLDKGIRESALLLRLKSYIDSYHEIDTATKIKYENTHSTAEEHNLQNIKGKLGKLEQTVMRYLSKKQKAWETKEVRTTWRKKLKGSGNTVQTTKLLLELAEKTSKPISLIASDSESDHKNTDTELHRVPIKLWKYSRHCDSLWFNYIPLIHTDSQLNLAVHTFTAVFKNYVDRREEQAKTEKRMRGQHNEVCYICSDYGYLLCCDGCSRAVHPHCEGLKDVPKDNWYCKTCREDNQNRISRRVRLS